MSQQLIIGIITAIAVVFAAIISAPRLLRDVRSNIAKDLQIYKSLPDKSPAKGALLARIERQIEELDLRDKARRQPVGIGVGISFLVIGGALLWFLFIEGGYWWWGLVVVIPILLFGLIGLIISSRKVPRDDQGVAIKKEKTK